MKRAYPALLLGALTLAVGACGSDSGSSPTPPVAATPTPAPSPSATPGNPMASVTAKMFTYTRELGAGAGYFQIPPAPPFFISADKIDVDCTPRDAAGRPTSNHPPNIEWYYTSGPPGGLVDKVDYVIADDDSFVPQVNIRYSTRTGFFEMWCKVAGFESNHLRFDVRYVDPNNPVY